ncbi:DNRLRE domain-containing protein [Clostridium sp. Mt-5]|uniref:DNRLRE domain-containing protein n=1 Tax=Clostridium moutaii TaxID=3240932 RepID=A0ABV4BL62_9CLOT
MSYVKTQIMCMKSLTVTDFKSKGNIEDDILKVGFDGKNIYRSYMYFNIDNIPKNQFVDFVYLYVYLSKIDTEHSKTTFYIQPLQEDFDKYTTFENQPQYCNRQIKFEVNRNSNALMRVDMTHIFNEWNSGHIKNKGIIIKSGEKKKSLGNFASSLIYDYEFIPKLMIGIPELNHNYFQGIVDIIEKHCKLEFYKIKSSPPISVERIIQGTFFIDNIGNTEVKAIVEVSCDLCNWIKDEGVIVNANSSEILIAKYYGKYYRVRFECLEYASVNLKFIYQVYR